MTTLERRSRSSAELTLKVQLEQAGIPFEREYSFASQLGRRWRSDFAISTVGVPPSIRGEHRYTVLLVEIDGGAFLPGGGRHTRGAGFEADLEKLNAAALLGYRVLRFTPAMVNDGRALSVIRSALGLAVPQKVAG